LVSNSSELGRTSPFSDSACTQTEFKAMCVRFPST
jgi:hypothetical protein